MRRIGASSLVVWLAFTVPALAQNTTTRISVSSTGAETSISSELAAISANGRFVAFDSAASFVPDDTNDRQDVFVYDRQSGALERVSVGSGGVQGTGDSNTPSISGDGRFVAFQSFAPNLVSGDTNNFQDIFVRDRLTNTTMRVSMGATWYGGPGTAQGNGDSVGGEISEDGRFVVFHTDATNLVSNDTNKYRDVVLANIQTRVLTLLSVSSTGAGLVGGDSANGTINADGSIVAFQSSATNAVAGDTNGVYDVFVRDLPAGTTTRISVGPGGVQANASSLDPRISADGRIITFSSDATTLDPRGKGVFTHNRQTGVTSGEILYAGTTAYMTPAAPAISGNGRYICFEQLNTATGNVDLSLFDRETQTKTKVTVATNGDVGNRSSSECAINTDGTVVAFTSASTNLVPNKTNKNPDIFVRTIFPEMALDKTSLTFSAVTSGATFVTQTAAQTIRLTQTGNGIATWSASANQPWLQVSPGSGSGSDTLSISVQATSGLPASGTVTAQIFVSLVGAVNTVPAIQVALTLTPVGTTVGPFGTVDTPVDHRTGVTGAVPFTGWALDDVGVSRASICRAASGAEVAPVDPNCGGAAEIFIGFGVFIDGARPDVAASFPAYPLSTRSGWGFMVLTNFLPNQGNGTYRFTMRAQDYEGNWFVLGTRTMTCANATATLPFGTIDTPEQGGIVSGSSYVNFGWALTPLPKTIPTDGSTIRVLIDGVDSGPADYNHARPDIQALFPGFNNTNGAVGFKILDTTPMTNGLHTISWTVTDNQAAIEGLGSRFFTVSNGVSALTAVATAASTSAAMAIGEDVPIDPTPLVGRRGWDLDAPYESFAVSATGAIVIRSEEVNRVELQLGDGTYAAYLRTPRGLVSLPIGSRLDAATNTFTWAPGVGFVGRYDFVFVRLVADHPVSRREVRIILQPQGQDATRPR